MKNYQEDSALKINTLLNLIQISLDNKNSFININGLFEKVKLQPRLSRILIESGIVTKTGSHAKNIVWVFNKEKATPKAIKAVIDEYVATKKTDVVEKKPLAGDKNMEIQAMKTMITRLETKIDKILSSLGLDS